MLSAPSHVLPPVTTLCSKFLHSLLINKEPDRYEQLFNVQIHSLTPSSQTISFSAAEREMGIRYGATLSLFVRWCLAPFPFQCFTNLYTGFTLNFLSSNTI